MRHFLHVFLCFYLKSPLKQPSLFSTYQDQILCYPVKINALIQFINEQGTNTYPGTRP
jgi:hypothetical protein